MIKSLDGKHLLSGLAAGTAWGGVIGLTGAAYQAVIEEEYFSQGLYYLAASGMLEVSMTALFYGALAGFLTAFISTASGFCRSAAPAARIVKTAIAAAILSCGAVLWWGRKEILWSQYIAEASPGTMALHGLGMVLVCAFFGGALALLLEYRKVAIRAGMPAAILLIAPHLLLPLVGPKPEGPNLLLLTVDTLRADRLGCYGYKKARTPNLDRLAREGARWSTVAASAPVTLTSTATLLTGLDPMDHGVRYNGYYRLAGDKVTLAEILGDRGYRTGAVIGNFALDHRFGIDQGFEFYDDRMTKRMDDRKADKFEVPEDNQDWWLEYRRTRPAQRYADEITEEGLKWLDRHGEAPFFLWLHYMDPHSPYAPPPSHEDFDDPYDGEVAFVDEEIGRLLEAYRKRYPSHETLVVILADHGESLGEHGYTGHTRVLYEQTMRIPLIMHLPSVLQAGRVEEDLLGAREIPRMILKTMGIAVMTGLLSQTEFIGGAAGADSAAGDGAVAEPWAYGETYFPIFKNGKFPSRCCRTREWKYIDHGGGKRELYNLARDAGEQLNVIHRQREKAKALQSLLESRTAGSTASDSAIVPDRDTLDRLKSLGY